MPLTYSWFKQDPCEMCQSAWKREDDLPSLLWICLFGASSKTTFGNAPGFEWVTKLECLRLIDFTPRATPLLQMTGPEMTLCGNNLFAFGIVSCTLSSRIQGVSSHHSTVKHSHSVVALPEAASSGVLSATVLSFDKWR